MHAGGAEAEVRRRGFWGAMASTTSLGWVMAVPIALGVLIGSHLDHRLGTSGLWTLALLGVGIGIAALEAYLVLRRALRSKNHG